MRLALERDDGIPLYIQLYQQLRRQITDGELTAGMRLPSERKLAEHLNVNRTTVLSAYNKLKTEGLIGSRVGDGTVVLDIGVNKDGKYSKIREPAWNQLFSQYINRLDSFLVADLLTLASRSDVIHFATGLASPESGPLETLRGIEREVVEDKNYRALMHTPTEGLMSLRQSVSRLMCRRGVYCRPEEIMMLAGSQEGIDLAARVFIDPGDIVVLEEPTYFPAIQAFTAVGARVIGIPVDENGMQVEVLEQLLTRYRPKLIYTSPTFQNPSGVSMSGERRRRLIELASRHGIIVLEDDAYGDLCYEGTPLPMLKSYDSEGYVIYLSTFSKNIYPGLRLGWITAHRTIINRFASARKIIDLHSNSLSQWIVERFINSGALEEHLIKICKEYKMRRDLMYNALEKYAPGGMRWNRPAGGYYIWCRLPDGLSANNLIAKAAEHRVAFIPGSPFFATQPGDGYVRLNFTYAKINEIEEGIKRLCAAVNELSAMNVNGSVYQPEDINPIV